MMALNHKIENSDGSKRRNGGVVMALNVETDE